MGGAVATILSGTYPERIIRLVMLEAVGPISEVDANNAPETLRHYFSRKNALQNKSMPIYSSIEDAVIARTKGQLTITKEGANILVSRGLKKVQMSPMKPEEGVSGTKEHKKGRGSSSKKEVRFTWRTDQRLTLPTPLPFSEEMCLGFFRNITCPVMFVIAEKSLIHDYWNTPEIQSRVKAIQVRFLAFIGERYRFISHFSSYNSNQ